VIGIPVARLFGIEIRVHLGWVLPLALIAVVAVDQIQSATPSLEPATAWGLGAVVAAAFFLSSLVHDLVHAIVARSRGIPVSTIAVSFFGGATPFDPVAPNATDDLAIAASGPLASLAIAAAAGLLGALAAALGGDLALLAVPLAALLVLNALLGGVNLVPAYPLDGGRIVRALAWRRTGSEQSGWRAAAASGRISGIAAVIVGIGVLAIGSTTNGAMIAVSGWFLILSARTIRDRTRVDELIGDLHVRDAMEAAGATVHPTLTLDTFAAQVLDGDSGTTAVPVTENDEVVGLVGVRQLNRVRRGKWPDTRVQDVMIRPPRLVLLSPEDPLPRAVIGLQRANVDGLPVLEGKELVGVLTRPSVGKVVAERMAKVDRGTRVERRRIL
jgi:Zn-dependent protease/predicted transcriptional regulator